MTHEKLDSVEAVQKAFADGLIVERFGGCAWNLANPTDADNVRRLMAEGWSFRAIRAPALTSPATQGAPVFWQSRAWSDRPLGEHGWMTLARNDTTRHPEGFDYRALYTHPPATQGAAVAWAWTTPGMVEISNEMLAARGITRISLRPDRDERFTVPVYTAPASPEGLTGEELYAAVSLIGARIEQCGASEMLTRASSLACDLAGAIGNRWNPPREYALRNVLDAIEEPRLIGEPATEQAGAVIVGWVNEDELPEGYPYDAMFPFSKVDIVRMFPVYAPITAPAASPRDGVKIPDACPFGTWHDNMGRGWGDEETAKRMSVAEEPGEAFFDPSLYARGWNECREAFAMLNAAAPSPATEQAGAVDVDDCLIAEDEIYHRSHVETELWHEFTPCDRHGNPKPAPVGADAVERVSDVHAALVGVHIPFGDDFIFSDLPAARVMPDGEIRRTLNGMPITPGTSLYVLPPALAAATQEGGA